jgi:hypothetical protein
MRDRTMLILGVGLGIILPLIAMALILSSALR